MAVIDSLTILKWLILGLAAWATLFLVAFVLEVQRERSAQIETHWGGFGGGLGGWRISRSFLYLGTALSFAILATILGTSIVSELKKPAPQALVDKYQSVVRLMAQENIRNIQSFVQASRLTLKGEAPSTEARNKVWDQIKLVNPALDDVTADIPLAAAKAQAVQPAK